MNDKRYDRGMEMLRQIDGGAGEGVIESLKDIAPDLGRYIVEFALGIFTPDRDFPWKSEK